MIELSDFLLPIGFNKVGHSYRSKTVNANNQGLAEIPTIDNVVYNIISYFVKTRRGDEGSISSSSFKTLATIIIKFFILKNTNKVSTESRILVLYFG